MKSIVGAFLGFLLTGCGAGAKTCQIVDVAHEACTVLKYLGPDGQPQQVQVTKDDVATFGAAMRLKREVGADGGSR